MAELTESVLVDLEGAETVHAKMKLESGRLAIMGGAAGLMQGTFAYASEWHKPVVTYEVSGAQGALEVKGPPRERSQIDAPKYRWDLSFGSVAPVQLKTKLGSGSATVVSAGMVLSVLDIATGSGPTSVDLSSDQPQLTRVSIKTASGHSHLLMDGVYEQLDTVEVATGSGPIDVELRGVFPMLRKLKVRSASGIARVTLAGRFLSLEQPSVSFASGAAVVDLSGVEPDMTASGVGNVKLDCVSGTMTVVLREEVPASIDIATLSGKVDAPAFRGDGRQMTNATWDGEGLRIRMSTISGKLKVRTADAAAAEAAPVGAH